MNKANSIQISQASASNASFSHLPIEVFLYFTTSFLFHMLFNVKKKKIAIWLHSGFHGRKEGINQGWLKPRTEQLGSDDFSVLD